MIISKKSKSLSLCLFLITLLALAGSCAHTPESTRSIASLVDGYKLPAGIEKMLYTEQVLLSRELNEEKIMSPKINKQEEFYRPENRQVFALKTYWIDEEDLFTFKDDSASPILEKIMFREFEGKKEWRLIVHPESEGFYEELIKKATRAEDFLASSTSSSRTLIVWPKERPDLAFFGKLSLNKEIGGVVRTIPATEVARSLGTTKLLTSIQNDLPSSFHFLPETMGLSPKGQERGGMIIREIPQSIKDADEVFVPLFSLYGKCLDCKEQALLLTMLQQSKINPADFIRQKIISPFLDQWLELVLKQGISMEPHAQNVLIGLGKDKFPNGKFLHRDFGGFNVNLKFREETKLPVPRDMPTINDIFTDYHQKFHVNSVKDSLHTYFIEGFVYNLDQNLSKWANEELIDQYQTKPSKKFFQNMVYEELAKKLNVSKNEVMNSNSLADVIGRIQTGRPLKENFFKRSCKQLMNFFID